MHIKLNKYILKVLKNKMINKHLENNQILSVEYFKVKTKIQLYIYIFRLLFIN